MFWRLWWLLLGMATYFKQLLDEVFVISGIIKIEVSVISRSRRPWLFRISHKPNLIIVLLYIVFSGKESNNKRFQPVSKLVLIPAGRSTKWWNISFLIFVSHFVFSETLLSSNFWTLIKLFLVWRSESTNYEFPSPPDAWHIALGNHWCIARATYRLVNNLLVDYSLICRLRGVARIARISCRLLANEKKDSGYNV